MRWNSRALEWIVIEMVDGDLHLLGDVKRCVRVGPEKKRCGIISQIWLVPRYLDWRWISVLRTDGKVPR
jgi:hypothetical protein